MLNPNRRKLISNYILRKDVEGRLLQREGILDEDIPWTAPAGTLVTVYETRYNWIVERESNFLPGLPMNVMFRGVIEKPQEP